MEELSIIKVMVNKKKRERVTLRQEEYSYISCTSLFFS